MQEIRALKNLLINKGVITQEEFDEEFKRVQKLDWAERHNYRLHIDSAEAVRYEISKDGEWKSVEDPLTLKKGDKVRLFDTLTNSRLETERGDDIFVLYADYDGSRKYPLFE